MRTLWTRRSSVALGLIYAVDCVVESVAHRNDGLAFWFGTTFTAAALVLLGTLRPTSNPFVGAVLVSVGAAVGMLPTMWTIVIPVFALGVIALAIVDAGIRYDARPV